MVQIIQEKRQPKFGELLGRGLAGAAETAALGIPKLMGERKENKYLSELTGLDFDAVQDPETRKGLMQSFLKRKETDKEKFSTGLETIQKMREIAGKKNIGRLSSIPGFFPGETAKDRAEFAQLGTSLIPLVAAGVPIRNQKEFEQYRKVITDPSSPLSAIEGALNGLEGIFSSKLQPSRGHEEKEEKEEKKVKFNANNPEHIAKFKQLDKKHKGNREKVNKDLAREFSL
jgi:hypothetical protein